MDSIEEEGDFETTFMIRGLPHYLTRSLLEQILDSQGFVARYNFIYLPTNLHHGGCFGYGFVNLVNSREARRFVEHFQGFGFWPTPGPERSAVHTSEALQGLDELVERYRNSPLLHKSVPDGVRPAIYSDGVRVPFPKPTEPLQRPRMRKARSRQQPQLAASA